jgi:Putative peptidoglycan binding domain
MTIVDRKIDNPTRRLVRSHRKPLMMRPPARLDSLPGARGSTPCQTGVGNGRRPIQKCMRKVVFVFAVAVGLSWVASLAADENVRAVQTKLRDGGFYSGAIDGAYSSQLAAALTRYQIRNGLPITGQLDVDTSKALGAKPAITTSDTNSGQGSETWRQLRKTDQQSRTKTKTGATTRSPSATENVVGGNGSATASSSPTVAAATKRETAPVDSPAATSSSALTASRAAAPSDGSSGPDLSVERLRDYVAAFVLAGLDPHVGSEVDFFADRVQYYDDGNLNREKIRQDLQRYAARWPERRFWLAGDIHVEPQTATRVRVTFPLRFDLHNGSKHSSGKVDKSIVLEAAGDDLEIVAVNERKTN